MKAREIRLNDGREGRIVSTRLLNDEVRYYVVELNDDVVITWNGEFSFITAEELFARLERKRKELSGRFPPTSDA